MDNKRLKELAGITESNYEVGEMKDTIKSLREKLKAENVDTSKMSDELVFRFATAMKKIK